MTLQGRSIETASYGTISSLRPKIWDILQTELNNTVSPELLKKIVNGLQRIVHAFL